MSVPELFAAVADDTSTDSNASASDVGTENTNDGLGNDGLCNASDNPTSEIETSAVLDIEALLDDPVPSDWDDPAARAARRERLIDVACQAAEMVVEMLVHNQLATASGVKPTAEDMPVVAAARAIEALHRGLADTAMIRCSWMGGRLRWMRWRTQLVLA